MKLKTKCAAVMRDEPEEVLGCPVEVVEDREAKYPCKMEYAVVKSAKELPIVQLRAGGRCGKI